MATHDEWIESLESLNNLPCEDKNKDMEANGKETELTFSLMKDSMSSLQNLYDYQRADEESTNAHIDKLVTERLARLQVDVHDASGQKDGDRKSVNKKMGEFINYVSFQGRWRKLVSPIDEDSEMINISFITATNEIITHQYNVEPIESSKHWFCMTCLAKNYGIVCHECGDEKP